MSIRDTVMRDRLRDETGVALIFALLSAVILGGVAVLFLATTVNEIRFTGAARDIEIALHVAEAASDEVVARVNREEDFATTWSGGDITLDDGTLASDESTRDWVEAMADLLAADGVDPVVTGRTGEAYGIRPVDGSGDPRDMVFGISAVPSFADAKHVRIVKLQFDRKFFQPSHGLLNCGDLEIGGNGKVLGQIGSVHSNGNVTVGGSHEIEDELSASGSITGTPNAGAVTALAPEEFCPRVEAQDFYGRAELPYTCYEPDVLGCTQRKGTDGKAILWWDLCADGTARKAASTPCAGTIVYDEAAKGANNHLGWKFSTPGGDPTWEATDIQSGIYYIERGVGSIRGKGSGTVTVLVELDESDDGDTGNLAFRGSSAIDPALEGLLFVADRDFEANGTASGGGLDAEGLVATGEQVKLDGTASFRGTIYARDDPHTPDSPVSKSVVKGNFSVTYDNQLDVPLIGIIRVTAWNEL